MPTGKPNPPLSKELFEELTERRKDGCLAWTGRINPGGYPVYKYKGVWIYIHRWSYETFVGPIPEGLTIDHLCHDPKRCKLKSKCPHRSCVDFGHLEAITNGENSMRGGGPMAMKARQKKCIKGHRLSGKNLYLTPDGRRQCRTCRRGAVAEFARRKAVNTDGTEAPVIQEGRS